MPIKQRDEERKITWIPCSQLSIVWADAQRPLIPAHAQNIADNLDPEMFGTLAVTKPNGHGIYHIIDGHHRKVAVETKYGKDERVPCQIFDAHDPARAAELFDSINSHRKRPQPLELFRVRVTAKKDLQVEVNKIVTKCGYVVRARATNSIVCVASLEAVYLSNGPIILEAVLRLLRKTWGDDNAAVNAHFVRGFGLFLSEFRHVDFEKLSTVLSNKYTPARLVGAAKYQKETVGSNMSMAVRDLTVRAYNTIVRGDKNKLKVKK